MAVTRRAETSTRSGAARRAKGLTSQWASTREWCELCYVLFTKLCALIACAAVAVPTLAAEDQRFGDSWKGTLRDAHGTAIAGAVVRVQSAGTKAAATTRGNGQFAFGALPAGEYAVSVAYKGATAKCSRPVRLPGNGATAVLELSADGSLSLLAGTESREGTGGEQLSAKAVSAMPLNKRDFSQLLLLAAGTMTDTNGASNFTQQFAVNGQRGTAAVFAMDGADSTDPEMGGATFTNFNVDAVQEIRSSSGWMPAEIGRGAAGFTDIITKSGANSVHGSVFEFLRNAALDARNFFDYRTVASPRRIPPFIRNEFGLTSGGPVLIPHFYDGRNRTFYFAEYQGFRQVLSDTEVLPVPTAARTPGFRHHRIPGRYADRAGGSAHRGRAGALSSAERPAGPLWRAHLGRIVEGNHGCRSVLRAHRS